jgi:hypothetical protein
MWQKERRVFNRTVILVQCPDALAYIQVGALNLVDLSTRKCEFWPCQDLWTLPDRIVLAFVSAKKHAKYCTVALLVKTVIVLEGRSWGMQVFMTLLLIIIFGEHRVLPRNRLQALRFLGPSTGTMTCSMTHPGRGYTHLRHALTLSVREK